MSVKWDFILTMLSELHFVLLYNSNAARINVAVSRARHHLIVIGNGAMLVNLPLWSRYVSTWARTYLHTNVQYATYSGKLNIIIFAILKCLCFNNIISHFQSKFTVKIYTLIQGDCWCTAKSWDIKRFHVLLIVTQKKREFTFFLFCCDGVFSSFYLTELSFSCSKLSV